MTRLNELAATRGLADCDAFLSGHQFRIASLLHFTNDTCPGGNGALASVRSLYFYALHGFRESVDDSAHVNSHAYQWARFAMVHRKAVAAAGE